MRTAVLATTVGIGTGLGTKGTMMVRWLFVCAASFVSAGFAAEDGPNGKPPTLTPEAFAEGQDFPQRRLAQLPITPSSDDRQAIIRFINRERTAHGLTRLVEDKRLSVAAQSQAAWVIKDGKSGHLQGEMPAKGKSYEEFLQLWSRSDWHASTRVVKAGYVTLDVIYKPLDSTGPLLINPVVGISELLGENVAYGATTSPMERFSPERIVKEWMASPGHRKTILCPRFREIGVGYAVTPGVASRNEQAAGWCTVFSTPELRAR